MQRYIYIRLAAMPKIEQKTAKLARAIKPNIQDTDLQFEYNSEFSNHRPEKQQGKMQNLNKLDTNT